MSHVLSQEEISALLQGLSEGDIETSSAQPAKPEQFKSFDLTNQERIVRGKMPALDLVCERFARTFRSTLSAYIGQNCYANLRDVEISKFGQFSKKLPLPSSLHVFRMPPLPGYGLLSISTPLAFALVDILFGGTGQSRVKMEGRDFSSIENRILTKVSIMVFDDLKAAWEIVHPLDFIYVRSELNPLSVAIVPPTDIVVVASIEIEIGGLSGLLSLCLPYSTLSPIREKLTAGFQGLRAPSELDGTSRRRIQRNLEKVTAEVRVELAKGCVSVKELLELEVGDVISLDTPALEDAVIKVEGEPKYRGHVGSNRGSHSVRVSRLILDDPEE